MVFNKKSNCPKVSRNELDRLSVNLNKSTNMTAYMYPFLYRFSFAHLSCIVCDGCKQNCTVGVSHCRYYLNVLIF